MLDSFCYRRWFSIIIGAQRLLVGLSQLKWGTNTFFPYLVIDPVDDPQPRPKDAEEWLTVERRVTIPQLKQMILHGEVMLPSVQTTFMALDRLEKMNLLQYNERTANR